MSGYYGIIILGPGNEWLGDQFATPEYQKIFKDWGLKLIGNGRDPIDPAAVIAQLNGESAIGWYTRIFVKATGIVRDGKHYMNLGGEPYVSSTGFLNTLQESVQAYDRKGRPVSWTGPVVLHSDYSGQVLTELDDPDSGAPTLTRALVVNTDSDKIALPFTRLLLASVGRSVNPYHYFNEFNSDSPWTVRQPDRDLPLFKVPLPESAAGYNRNYVDKAMTAYLRTLEDLINKMPHGDQRKEWKAIRSSLREARNGFLASPKVGALAQPRGLDHLVKFGSPLWCHDIGEFIRLWESSEFTPDGKAKASPKAEAFYQSFSREMRATDPTRMGEILTRVLESARSMKAAELVFDHMSAAAFTPAQVSSLLASFILASNSSRFAQADRYLNTSTTYLRYFLANGVDFTAKTAEGGASPVEQLVVAGNEHLLRLIVQFDSDRVLQALFGDREGGEPGGRSLFLREAGEIGEIRKNSLSVWLLELVPGYLADHPDSRDRLFKDIATYLAAAVNKASEHDVQGVMIALNFWSLEDRQALLNRRLADGATVLQLALEGKALSLAEYLVSLGADIHAPGRGDVPVVNYVRNNPGTSLEVISFLGRVEGLPSGSNPSALTYLLKDYATNPESRNVLDRLLKEQPKSFFDGVNSEGQTFLMKAIEAGQFELAELALSRTRKVNQVDFNGKTALTLALDQQNPALVAKLHQSGAHASAANTEHQIVSEVLVLLQSRQRKGAAALLAAVVQGAPVERQLAVLREGLLQSARNLSTAGLKLFAQAFKSVPEEVKSGAFRDALEALVLYKGEVPRRKDMRNSLEVLLAYADPTQANAEGQTLLGLAIAKGHVEAIEIFLAHGAGDGLNAGMDPKGILFNLAMKNPGKSALNKAARDLYTDGSQTVATLIGQGKTTRPYVIKADAAGDALIWIDQGVTLGAGVQLDASVRIGRNSSIGQNVRLEEGVSVGEKVVIEFGSQIGKNVQLGNRVKIGVLTGIAAGVIVGRGAEISESFIEPGVRIAPGAQVHSMYVTQEGLYRLIWTDTGPGKGALLSAANTPLYKQLVAGAGPQDLPGSQSRDWQDPDAGAGAVATLEQLEAAQGEDEALSSWDSEESREMWAKALDKLGLGADAQRSKEQMQEAFTAERLRPVLEEIFEAFKWKSAQQRAEVVERDAGLMAREFGDDVAEAVAAVLANKGPGEQTVSGQELAKELSKKSAQLRVWEDSAQVGQSEPWLQAGYDGVEVLSVLDLMAGGKGYGVDHKAGQFYDSLSKLGELAQQGLSADKLRERYALAVRQEAGRQGVQEGAGQEAVVARELKNFDLRYAPLLEQLKDGLEGALSREQIQEAVGDVLQGAAEDAAGGMSPPEWAVMEQVASALAEGVEQAALGEESLAGQAEGGAGQESGQAGQGYDAEAVEALGAELAQARELARLRGSAREEDKALGEQLERTVLQAQAKERGLAGSEGSLAALNHYNGYFMDGYLLVGVGRTIWQLEKAREHLVSAGQDTGEVDKLLVQQALLGTYALGLLGSKVALQVGQVLKSDFVPLVQTLSGGAGSALMGYFALTQARALGDSVNRYIADHDNGVIRHEDDWAVAGTFSSGAGADLMAGGAGNDKYLFARGDGVDTLVDSAGTDKLGFAVTGGTGGAGTGRIDYNQLWFERQGSDLDIRVMGSTDEVRLRDWYLGSAGQLETIEAASSEGVSVQLLGADVQRLVEAMAGMSPPTGAASWNALSTTQNQQLLALGVWH